MPSLGILTGNTLPDSSGFVFPQKSSTLDTNGLFPRDVWIFTDGSTKIGLTSEFNVPADYASGGKFRVVWHTTATTGDVEFDLDYRAIAVGETMDPSSAQESLNQNDTAGGSANLRQDAILTATGGNFTAGDEVEYTLFRDLTDSGDTISASVTVSKVYFDYTAI